MISSGVLACEPPEFALGAPLLAQGQVVFPIIVGNKLQTYLKMVKFMVTNDSVASISVFLVF